MSVLICENIEIEGPGTIEDYLKERGKKYHILDFSDCKAEDNIPDIREYTHLVIMGGPMAVYEPVGFPFIHYETAMIRAFIKSRRPVLGICLGAQMIANALGADVYPGGTEEVGWYKVDITKQGMEDSAIARLAVNNQPVAEVFQWHGDTFDLPEKAVRLSSSRIYKNQAFRYGSNVYGLQFHIEVKPGMIKGWFEKEEKYDSEKMIEQTQKIFPEYQKRAFDFYEIFFR
ncbi:MAG TPA: GMP synthase [Nitrospirae bacterium]|nr:GMP synthase [glutamine-hydrolyzing] [bacterium BMS3Abin10]GBE39468.1 GMP synthase [glutamine-hydrolyzing] [bacterium BMS3Bbin08]HDH49871.1 GMP synthase [Nitrospirota bacterium]HDO26410.1 GMP synthase [Nitrospirota bacterium]